MSELIITRGISGSGKSTWADAWVIDDPQHRAEVNRDHLRLMMHGGHIFRSGGVLDRDTESMVTTASQTAVKELLKRGVSVVVSDTNLPQRTARDWLKMARFAGAEFRVVDFTHIPLEVCLDRNMLREGADRVPEEVVLRQYERFVAPLKGQPMPLPTMDEDSAKPDFVVPNYDLKPAYVVDIDGTVALKGNRSPFDETKVHEDRPNDRVIETVNALSDAGYRIVFLSGRTKACEEETYLWLQANIHAPIDGLFMRPVGDTRKDSIVKRELFDKHVRNDYNVVAVLDDRNQVVDMWRDELGLTCLQVAPGDF